MDRRNIWFCNFMTQYEQTSLLVLLWQESVIKHFSFFHTPLFFVFFLFLFVYCLFFWFEEFFDDTINSLFLRQQLHYHLSAFYFDKVLLVSASLNSVTKNVSLKTTYRFLLLSYTLLVFQTLISRKGVFWLYLAHPSRRLIPETLIQGSLAYNLPPFLIEGYHSGLCLTTSTLSRFFLFRKSTKLGTFKHGAKLFLPQRYIKWLARRTAIQFIQVLWTCEGQMCI